MRVLIVEDVPAEAETFADLVSQHGHQPIVVRSAEAALDSLTVSPPDAILLEMYLPGMSGLEFLRVLSERRQRLPVVAMSGVVSEAEARQSLKLGAVEFLPKPLGLGQLGVVLDFLELQVLTRRFTEDVMRLNQRRYPRVEVSLEVQVEKPAAGLFDGRVVDLSPFGVKLRAAGAVQPGATARLSFTPPDGDKGITVLALMVRKDPDAQAYAFINLTNADFTRLKNFVDARLPG